MWLRRDNRVFLYFYFIWIYLDFFFFMYCIRHCFICRPSDSTVSEDAKIEPMTVATSTLAVRLSNHSARSHPQSARSDLIHNSARSHPSFDEMVGGRERTLSFMIKLGGGGEYDETGRGKNRRVSSGFDSDSNGSVIRIQIKIQGK
jgi:hypothetical protein